MKSTHVTVATLNLWRFTDWEVRLPTIIEVLKKLKPDMVFLQEVQRDPTKADKNQLEILNDSLGYPYSTFARADIKTSRKGVPLPMPVDHGLGVLSVFPFESEIIPLTQAEGDKEKRIIVKNDVRINDIHYLFTNVHFANNDLGAEAHFKETLSIMKERNLQTVLLGDFNIEYINKVKELYADSYVASTDLYEYISHVKDGFSYDQILLPKGFDFISFDCRKEFLSDHSMLVATIALPK